MVARSAWQAIPGDLRASIASSWEGAFSIPAESIALYSRWWQLETWLRSLCYLELKARDGNNWSNALPQQAAKRGVKDQRHHHMVSPDAQARLAYLDASQLLELIENEWSLFGGYLLAEEVWRGRIAELLNIRNRIGHCRRPHHDDLARLEQTLRDLEAGAFRAAAYLNRTDVPVRDLDDPLVEAWMRWKHPDARRLVDHADRQYDVQFSLHYSARPWAPSREEHDPISGTQGFLWHASWLLRNAGLDLRAFWEDSQVQAVKDLLVFVSSDSPAQLEVTFSAVDDHQVTADAIGSCFDALLETEIRWGRPMRDYERWAQLHADLDPRVQVSTTWSIVSDSTVPIKIFGA